MCWWVRDNPAPRSRAQAQVAALATCGTNVIDMNKSLRKSFELTIGETTINVSIHEYNAGDLISANSFQPQFTPQSNKYSAKTIWFRKEIVKRGINIF